MAAGVKDTVLWGLGFLLVGAFLGARFSGLLGQRGEEAPARRLEAYQGRIAELEVAFQVDRLAQEKLREEIAALQAERTLVAAEKAVCEKRLSGQAAESPPGLVVEGLAVRPLLGRPRHYAWEMVVRRGGAALDVEPVHAVLTLSVAGRLRDRPDRLGLRELEPGGGADLRSLHFRHFAVVDGVLVLPPHFQAERLVVSVAEEGRPDSLLLRELPWPGDAAVLE